MSHEIKIPSLGESINEVQIAEWLKAEGDTVKQDENIAVIDSEKTTLELPAPATGRLAKILHQAGETVKIGEVIGQIETDSGEAGERSSAAREPAPDANPSLKKASAPPKGPPAAAKAASDPAKTAPDQAKPASKPIKAKTASAPDQAAPDSGQTTPDSDAAVSDLGKTAPTHAANPPADKAAEKPGEPKENPPAPGADVVEEPMEKPEATTTQPGKISTAPSSKREPSEARTENRSGERSGERTEQVVPMTMLRRTAARRLVEAKQQMAMLTTFNEVDLSAVQGLRKEYQDAFQKRHQVRLGLMSFFVKAAVEALKQFPQLNAEVRENNLVQRNFFDINVAIASTRGLVVPVLRDAGKMSFAEVEKTIGDLGRRAESGELKPAELAGGTFTITNGGVFGSLLSTPIINPPQTGVLGMHTIQERPVAIQGQVVIRPMMYLALTYDHRAVDGREAVLFLRRIKEVIESPSRVLMEI